MKSWDEFVNVSCLIKTNKANVTSGRALNPGSAVVPQRPAPQTHKKSMTSALGHLEDLFEAYSRASTLAWRRWIPLKP